MLRINTNVSAINALRHAGLADLSVSKSLERLSSGLRINRASDDAAGLSISESLRTQVRGSTRAAANLQDAISLTSVADGALNEIHATLQRMRELAVQASNGSLTASDRQATEDEFSQLQAEIGNISTNTTFNGTRLFTGMAGAYATGSAATSIGVGAAAGTSNMVLNNPSPLNSPSALNSVTVTVQAAPIINPFPAPPTIPPPQVLSPADYTVSQAIVGYNGTTPLYQYSLTINNTAFAGGGPFTVTANATMDYPTSTLPLPLTMQSGANYGQTEVLQIPPVNPGAIGVGSSNIATQLGAQAALTNLDTALAYISTARGQIGSSANSMQHAFNAMMIAHENQSASDSRIRDLDMADEMTNLTRQQILAQSSLQSVQVANDSRAIMSLFS